MDLTIKNFLNNLKKICAQLQPQNTPLSFLIITGQPKQGISTLLLQSGFTNYQQTNDNAQIYYNKQGIILDLNASWCKKNINLLPLILKKINHCNRYLKISGLILCFDINQLIIDDVQEVKNIITENAKLLNIFSKSLGYKTNLALLFTKLDLLAGFCDFFQKDHAEDIQKPLGFSIDEHANTTISFNSQFDRLIETIGQQVINKVHPVRSSVKRTLIREFPLQLASLKNTISPIIKNILLTNFNLTALYFTSGEQGGVSIDRLNKKIQEEYALTLQSQIHNATNHRAYFIEGALNAFQSQNKQLKATIQLNHKISLGILSGIAILGITIIASQYFKSSNLLDEASKNLIAYDSIGKDSNQQSLATYYLAKASRTLSSIPANSLSLPTLQKLKITVDKNVKQQITNEFIPKLLIDIEQEINKPNQSEVEKYHALKVYLMLANREHLSENDVKSWFAKHWQKSVGKSELNQKISILTNILHKDTHGIKINNQVVTDARNYLNALPTSYLYYSLAKEKFSKKTRQIEFDGFVIGADKIPFYLTKRGFHEVIKNMPKVIKQLSDDNWVLARQDFGEMNALLQQAYCYEYVIWWQNFIQKSHPLHAQTYEDAYNLAKLLRQKNMIKNLINIIQTQTSPIAKSSSDGIKNLFNQEIASKFSDINLVSDSTIERLIVTINELEKFLGTMSVINDDGRSAFNLTKSRFQGDILTNPLSLLYQQSEQLPKPISTWAKQIADDTWFTLIKGSRAYINNQWQKQVFQFYREKIANRYPFDVSQTDEITINDFNQFFSKRGSLNNFINEYLKPFLNTSEAKWQLKDVNNYVLPISTDVINELMRANVITNMFFNRNNDKSLIEFSLQNINLDPIISSMQLSIGEIKMTSNQSEDSISTEFSWPEANARLVINSIEGKHFEIEELGPWAFFKILQKVNVLVDEKDSTNLQIAFEINGNSGRYLLKTQNPVNPFIPGILDEFNLPDMIV